MASPRRLLEQALVRASGSTITAEEAMQLSARQLDILLVRYGLDPARIAATAGVPTMAEVSTMTDAELTTLLRRQGVSEALEDRVLVAVERAASRLINANAPTPALVDAVMAASERAIRRELQKASKELIRQYNAREQGVVASTMERWMSVQDNKVCEDCQARHGHTQTHADWVADGLPGSENTVCDGNCRCELVPDDAFTGPYERGDVRVTITQETA